MDTGRIIIDAPAEGAWNMAVDEALLETAGRTGKTTLRFYQWSEPTLSLGYFQRYEDRQQHEPSRNCALVRRSTGGGAIMHDRELTYSFVAPIADRISHQVEDLYRLFHDSLVAVLGSWRITARRLKTVGGKGAREPFLCFQRRAKGDVLIGDDKVAGSAQRRRKGAVLQHGSILLRRSDRAPELSGIVDLTGVNVTATELAQRWIGEIHKCLSVDMNLGILTESEQVAAAAIWRDKFAFAGWTKRR